MPLLRKAPQDPGSGSFESAPANPAATVSATWARRLINGLTEAGFDASGHCQRVGWDLSLLQDPQARVPWADVVELWAAAARSTGDPHLGLHAAETPPFNVDSPFGYLIASSPTLRDALLLMIRYQGLHSDHPVLALEERVDHTAVVVRLPSAPPPTSHQVEHVCALLKRTCAWIVGPTFRLLGVRFRHAGAASPGEHQRIFDSPVQFERTEDAVLLPNAMLSKPSLFANVDVLSAVRPIVERLLAERQSGDWALRVRTALQAQLDAPCRIDAVARQLGMSRRTLQRKLAGERSSFEKVLDESRRARALELIRREGMSLAEIGTAIGFSNTQAFARAFQRWTGVSPAVHRAMMSASPPRPSRG